MASTVNNDVAGRLALVTGASGGIGRACAQVLFLQHVHLALAYHSNRNGVTTLVEELRDAFSKAHPDVNATLHLAEEAKEHHAKGVDILIANAGFGKRITDIEDIPLDVFEHTLQVNLRAPFLLAKSVVGHMKQQQWGRIIFVSSISAYGVGLNGCRMGPLALSRTYMLKDADYAASKGGLTSMMKNLSTRLAEYRITVNDVSPAMIGETGLIPSGDSVPGLVESIPLGRLGVPEEVANVVLMFTKTGYMTGQSVLLAGGLNHK